MEMSTQLDGKVDKNVDDISSDDILVAQVNTTFCEPINNPYLLSSLNNGFCKFVFHHTPPKNPLLLNKQRQEILKYLTESEIKVKQQSCCFHL